MDNGRRFLPEMRGSGAPLLIGTLDSGRIRPQTGLYVRPDLQAIPCLQAMGIRVSGDFLPNKTRII